MMRCCLSVVPYFILKEVRAVLVRRSGNRRSSKHRYCCSRSGFTSFTSRAHKVRSAPRLASKFKKKSALRLARRSSVGTFAPSRCSLARKPLASSNASTQSTLRSPANREVQLKRVVLRELYFRIVLFING